MYLMLISGILMICVSLWFLYLGEYREGIISFIIGIFFLIIDTQISKEEK